MCRETGMAGCVHVAIAALFLLFFTSTSPGAIASPPAERSATHPDADEFPGDPLSAAYALLYRVVPSPLSRSFEMQLIPKVDGRDAMQLSSDSARGLVVLRGSGAVELASALNWYLNDYLNITFDWNTYAAGQFPQAAAGDHLTVCM